MAVLGHVDIVTRTFVAGWAFDPDAPGRPVSLEILVVGARRIRIEADIPRQDLKLALGARHPDATGRHGFRHDFRPPIHLFEERTIMVSVAGTGQMLPNGKRVLHALGTHPRAQPPLHPLMVLATEQVGATRLMAQLAAHPDIVTTPHHPYEVRQLGYHAAAFRTLVSPADQERSSHPDRMMGERYVVGFNPFAGPASYGNVADGAAFETYFEHTMPRLLAAAFRDIIRGYYDVIRMDQAKPGARFFSEKIALDPVIRMAARGFFGRVREIVLVRDPRDTLCAVRLTSRRTEAALLQGLRNTGMALRAIRDEQRDDVLFVRYEDLADRETETLAIIQAFLGVAAPFAPMPADAAAARRVKDGPAATIGRWRDELSRETLAACDATLAAFLAEFDYRA